MAGEISHKYRNENKNVFVLAFHVDYWNHLHWKDPFSRKAYTDRQYKYAQVLGARTLYTPQMIVNGETEFVGSKRNTAFQSIEAALSKTGKVRIKLSAQTESEKIVVSYAVQGAGRGDELNIALVEHSLVRKITSGENSGRTLHHENVVRDFKTVDMKIGQEGRLALEIPAGTNLQNAAIIAFTQKKRNRKITGASSVDL